MVIVSLGTHIRRHFLLKPRKRAAFRLLQTSSRYHILVFLSSSPQATGLICLTYEVLRNQLPAASSQRQIDVCQVFQRAAAS